ncbi:MAG TPA: ABC transporter permease, partial [bacterium]|nr:ABC transporter permease [bacterium]
YIAAVMAPVNGPEDFSIYVNYKAVWKIHEHHGEHEAEHGHEAEHENEDHKGCANYELHHGAQKEESEHGAENEHGTLSAVLVKTVNPIATAELEREYSSGSGSSATDVGKTVRRIVQYMNKAESAAGLFSYATLLIVLAMVFVTILMAVNERKKEMALMRTLGIGRMAISMTVMIETVLVTIAGILSGILIGHGVLWYLKPLIDFSLGIDIEPFIFTSVEIKGIAITLITGQILAFFAMIRIYNMNIIEEVARD